MKIKFWKLSGAGNDFVLLNGLPKGRSGAALAKALCDRHFGVGADGLLIMSRRNGATRLDYWNADGSAAFCGNGSRSGVVWAAAQGWLKGKSFDVKTNRGTLSARLTGAGRAEVQMPAPKNLKLGLKIGSMLVHFVDTGVPHAVVFVPHIDAVDVDGLGRELRFHKRFGKAGANVNFVERRKNELLIRTYERGVEGETLACGTGIVASAFIARVLGFDSLPVPVRARGGMLSVSFDRKARLEGPVAITFTGEVSL